MGWNRIGLGDDHTNFRRVPREEHTCKKKRAGGQTKPAPPNGLLTDRTTADRKHISSAEVTHAEVDRE